MGRSLALAVLACAVGGCFFDSKGVPGADGGSLVDADPGAADADPNQADARPPAMLIDTGLVVRYFMDETDTGQTATQLLDSAPDPLHVPITYATGMTWNNSQGNRGLEWEQSGAEGIAQVSVGTGKLNARLNPSARITLEVVARIDGNGADGSDSHLAGLRGGNPDFVLAAYDTNDIRFFRVGGVSGGEWLDAHDGQRSVFHLVFDTTLASENRLKLYVDGSLRTRSGGSPPASSTGPGLLSGDALVIGNRQDGGRSIDGKIYYVALYDIAMTPGEVANNAERLLDDDDSGNP